MSFADVVMILLTAASVIVATIALTHARNAASGAAGAVLEAKNANEIARKANALALASNSTAERAADDARDAPTQVAWDEYVVAIAALQTFDPAGAKGADGEAGPLLTQLRTRATILIDRLDWDYFDEWLAAEQVSGVQLMREALEKANALRRQEQRHPTIDEILAIDKNFHTWVAGLTLNVRRFRRVGLKDMAVQNLTAEAWKRIRATSERNGWPVPTGKIEGLVPYDPTHG